MANGEVENKTGFSFEDNITIGDGLIIGHWGKIVINGQVQFGNQMLHGHLQKMLAKKFKKR